MHNIGVLKYFLDNTRNITDFTSQFSDESRVPAHAKRAITTNFYSYRPNTANMNYGSNYIDRKAGRNLLAPSTTAIRIGRSTQLIPQS